MSERPTHAKSCSNDAKPLGDSKVPADFGQQQLSATISSRLSIMEQDDPTFANGLACIQVFNTQTVSSNNPVNKGGLDLLDLRQILRLGDYTSLRWFYRSLHSHSPGNIRVYLDTRLWRALEAYACLFPFLRFFSRQCASSMDPTC